MPARSRRPMGLVLAVTLSVLVAGCVSGAPWESQADASDDPLPVVTVTGPRGILVGDIATLVARVDGADADSSFWFWDFGDGVEHQDVGLTEVQHEFSEPGAHVVTVTVVDADGRRGVTVHPLAVDQEYTLEGTVSRGMPLGVGDAEFGADFEARAGLSAVRLDARFERGHPLSVVVDATPPKVVVRLLGPDDATLLEALVEVGADGEVLRAEVPGGRVAAPGDVRLEVVPEEGVVHFTATVRLAYGSA